MTPFALLCALAGLSQREAARVLNVSPSSVDKMARGVRATPPGLLAELRALIGMQELAAARWLEQCVSDLAAPADDAAAHQLGFPVVGAWGAAAARLVAASDVPVTIISAADSETHPRP